MIILTSGRGDLHLLKYLDDGMTEGFEIDFEESYPPETHYDIAIVLGDRYEALVNATEAIRHKCVLVHLHGGEVTEGSMDNMFRNAITKLAHYHFVATNVAALRVFSLKENNMNIYHVGALGVERVKSLLTGKPKQDRILFTWHPSTIDEHTAEETEIVLAALHYFKDFEIVVFEPNRDPDYEIVREKIDEFFYSHANCTWYDDLGDDYIEMMETSRVIVGNSSSGIIEAPSCYTPTVNIGDRQKGREYANSVNHCPVSSLEIINQIRDALKGGFFYNNPYEKEGTRAAIIEVLKTCDLSFVKKEV